MTTKRSWKRLLAASAALATALSLPWAASGKEPAHMKLEEQWKQVSTAEEKNLPESAAKAADEIYRKEAAAGDWPQATSALVRRIAAASSHQEEPLAASIRELEKSLSGLPPEALAMATTVLAGWYWDYYESHSWKFAQRSQTGQKGEDISAWDLRTLFDHVMALYEKALQPAAALKQASIANWHWIVNSKPEGTELRPTLFDFVSFQALTFLSQGSQAFPLGRDSVVFTADSPAFSDAPTFLKWNLAGLPADDGKVKALRIFQALLSSHPTGSSPFLDADLERLSFVRENMTDEKGDDEYQKRLAAIERAHPANAVAALAGARRATLLRAQGKNREAHTLAVEIEKRFPDSRAAAQCRTLLASMTARELGLETRSPLAPRKENAVTLRFRNLEKAYVKLVRGDWLESFRASDETLKRLKKADTLKSWEVDLDPGGNFEERTHSLKLPPLEAGFYELLVSGKPDFGENDNALRSSRFFVSSLGLVWRMKGEVIDGSLRHAGTGEPLTGARVVLWQVHDGLLKPITTVKVDSQGLFSLPFSRQNQGRQVVLGAEKDGERVGPLAAQYLYAQREPATDRHGEALFFTDRALYRPGQEIWFKVLLFKRGKESVEASPRERVAVELVDPNGTVMARQDLETNAFGSASARFQAPAQGALLGEFQLRASGAAKGSQTLRIEEYKRPKFEVKLGSPEGEVALGGKVRLSGQATTYTGVSLAGVPVHYRVQRSSYIPPWWLWRHAWDAFVPKPKDDVDVARGSVRTDGSGKFEISFVAAPDPSIPAEASPRFRYSVHVDVVDVTGEMQSAEGSVHVGHSALEPSIETSAHFTTEEEPRFVLRATNAGGQIQEIRNGEVHVYSLKSPSEPDLPDSPEHFRNGQAPEDSWVSWKNGKEVFRASIRSSAENKSPEQKSRRLEPGAYRAVFQVRDAAGRSSQAEATFLVIDPSKATFPDKIFSFLTARETVAKVGSTFEAWWGTGFPDGRALVEVEKGQRTLQRFFTGKGSSQARLSLPISEDLRGGITLRVSILHSHGFREHLLRVDVPWDEKDLSLTTSTFRSALQPGAQETWTLALKGPKGPQTAAELVATLYDASLDAISPLQWPRLLGLWPQTPFAQPSRSPMERGPVGYFGQGFRNAWERDGHDFPGYPEFVPSVGRSGGGYALRSFGGKMAKMSAMEPMMESAPAPGLSADATRAEEAAPPQGHQETAPTPIPQDTARRNLAETALFAPHLTFDSQGLVSLSFRVPDTLTTWRFMAMAHTSSMASGFLSATATSSKKLMVEPFLPRFLRTGDKVTIAARVSNRDGERLSGQGRIRVLDALSGKDVTRDFVEGSSGQPLVLGGGESRSLAWRLAVPEDFASPVTVTISAESGKHTDGEEQALPILTDKVYLTDSKAFVARKAGETKSRFDAFLKGQKDPDLKTLNFSIEYTPHTSWTVLGALSWLAEYPFEGSEQVFERLYANALGASIVARVPEIARAFAEWKKDPTKLPLERNDDLKKAALTETPWIRDAESESLRRKRMASLFDKESTTAGIAAARQRLQAMALSDGAWPWYPGGPASETMTLHIVSGVAHLKAMGVDPLLDVSRAVAWLDAQFTKRHQDIVRSKTKLEIVPGDVAYWLYARSRLGQKSGGATESAIRFWMELAERSAMKLPLLSQTHAAFALHAAGREEAVKAILASLRERALRDPENGMHWAEYRNRRGFWFDSPIETQAALIELFSEVAKDAEAVGELKAWLVTQKRTQAWESTKATADAVFALLLGGGNEALRSEPAIVIPAGGKAIDFGPQEAGSGYARKSFQGPQIVPALGDLTIRKATEGVSWGAQHWQYLAPLSRVEAHSSDLTLRRTLLVPSEQGNSWKPAGRTLARGTRVRVQTVIEAARDFEFVHLRDLRGAGLEPTQALSGYRSQDGLWYYEVMRDTGTDFFIDTLPKGRHVFEYELKVQHAGDFDGGHADMECLYAPEFRGRSASAGRLQVSETP